VDITAMSEGGIFPGVAVVTGAAGRGMNPYMYYAWEEERTNDILYIGIGSGVARAFARDGCMRIAITDLNVELLKQTRDTILKAYPKVQVYDEAGDIADTDFTRLFFENVAKEFGRIDYAVNCAGVLGNNQRSTETSPEDFDSVNNVNYRGCWLSSRAELHQMLQQTPLPSHDPTRPPQRGSIVNIASQLGIVSRPCARMS
jgi:NAD(P)-dependent dehydrogenase (short-subunit alcohol dehydrogenase family)